MLSYVRRSAQIVYGWLDWTVKNNLPLQQHEEDLATVQALMVRLRTLKQSAKLMQKTTLRHVVRQDTRWSSTFLMVHQYFRLLEHIEATDDAVVDVLPAPASNKRLRALLNDLKKIESVSKALQADNATLLDVRVWSDGLIVIKPHYVTYLGPRVNIVHSPDFEYGCVRVLEGKARRLTRGEKSSLHPLRCEDASDQAAESGDEDSFVEQFQKRHRLASVAPRYELLGSIPSTPNIAVRFFKKAIKLPNRLREIIFRDLNDLHFCRTQSEFDVKKDQIIREWTDTGKTCSRFGKVARTLIRQWINHPKGLDRQCPDCPGTKSHQIPPKATKSHHILIDILGPRPIRLTCTNLESKSDLRT
ncbi:Hypothetical protein PHPALM_13899 [Phytophthora palmivora]|uniref:Uncharacterized protein n=1 Tax=Phytophthora palmivora TaxID=4796 RepID=A0A2P4XW61_9STRA|nr:Hypothetical protein PHPALM_13899 [Phytophthora palmivora]